MSDSDQSRSASSGDSRHSHRKDSNRKSRESHGIDSDKSSYSENFYSDDEANAGKSSSKKKQPNGENNKGLQQRSRYDMTSNIRSSSYGGRAGEKSVAARHVISASRLKVNDLRNKATELANQLIDVQQENRDIKRQLRQRERRLEQYQHQENEMPSLLQRQAQEMNVYREQLRRQKKKYEEKEKKLKDTQEELQRNQKLLKKMKELVDDKRLAERDDLNNKLIKAEADLKEKETALKKLEEHIEHLKKNHKHELGIERARQKEANRNLAELQTEVERTRASLKEKEKELSVNSMRMNRQTKPIANRLGNSTSPPPDTQLHPVRNTMARNTDASRSGSGGSMDFTVDDKQQTLTKTILKRSSKEMQKKTEMRQQMEREREIESRREIERKMKADKDMQREVAANREHNMAASLRKSEEEIKPHKTLNEESERLERKYREDEEMRQKLEKELQMRDRKEREEREKHVRELEAGRQAQNLEEEEKLKQKAVLLAKIRAIDEQKLMNDKEFFVTMPSQNEFLPREREMMAKNEKNVPVFGEYKPSFLTGSVANKSSKPNVTNAKAGNETKPKLNLMDELFGTDGESNTNQMTPHNSFNQRPGKDVSKTVLKQPMKSIIDSRVNDIRGIDDDIEELVL